MIRQKGVRIFDTAHSSWPVADPGKLLFKDMLSIVCDDNMSLILSSLITSENLLEVGIEDEVCRAALEARLSPIALVIFPDTKSSYSLDICITCISC